MKIKVIYLVYEIKELYCEIDILKSHIPKSNTELTELPSFNSTLWLILDGGILEPIHLGDFRIIGLPKEANRIFKLFAKIGKENKTALLHKDNEYNAIRTFARLKIEQFHDQEIKLINQKDYDKLRENDESR